MTGAHSYKAAAQAAFLHPRVEGRLGHSDMLCQFADRPFVGSALDPRFATTISTHSDARLEQKAVHHLGREGIAPLGWPPAFAIEDGGNVGRAVPCAMELARTRQEVLVAAEPVEARDRPDQLM